MSLRRITRTIAVATAVAGMACTEATPPNRRIAILDEEGSSDWIAVSSGSDHTCGLKADGTAYCWGSNRYGQLGVARSDTLCGSAQARYVCSPVPHAVQVSVKFSAISAGARHTCGLTQAREAYCWGSNDNGQTGALGPSGPTLVRIPGALPWAQVSAGFSHSCAVRSDGALFCWGANDVGQLGNGGQFSGMVRATIPAPVASVSAGQDRTCARTTTNAVYCWGSVWTSRQDGLEISRSQLTPELVPKAPGLASISVGTFTTCGTDVSGFAYCWEANPRGEMGNGSQDGSTSPVRVLSDLEFIQVSAGIVQTCGVISNGTGYCWGDDSFGQLGVLPARLVELCGGQVLPCTTTPVAVPGRQLFTEISTGFGSHTCGVTTRGNLYCWGLGVSGQRGDGAIAGAVATPTKVVEPKR